jgi:MOSC domain-containing protein YiiM
VSYQTVTPTTAVEKAPLTGRVLITADGIEGDESGDKAHHHDEWMKVYAYSVEDYAWWVEQLGAAIPPGHFAENLTTEGVDLNAALVGETWRVGSALLQISHVRIPCQTFKGWMGHSGYDDTTWVKRFTLGLRPGPYFRVLQPGDVAAGDPIEVVARPDHDVTVRDLFLALTIDRSRLSRLRYVDGLKPWIYEAVAAHSAAR